MKHKRKQEQPQNGKDVEQKSQKEPKGNTSKVEIFPGQYIHYLQAKELLADRIDATPGEIAIWCWLGSEKGGLSAHPDPQISTQQMTFKKSVYASPDYISPLMRCWFRFDDIARFQPKKRRYLTSPELVDRWKSRIGPQTEAFIKSMVVEGKLLDLHPHTGRTQWREAGHFPGREWAIFPLGQVVRIEKKYFSQYIPPDIKPTTTCQIGVSAERIVGCFTFWDLKRWKDVLSRPPRYLEDSRIKPVLHRKAAFWNPAVMANCLWSYRLKYWDTRDRRLHQFARLIPSKIKLERIIKENFPDWLSQWQPDLD